MVQGTSDGDDWLYKFTQKVVYKGHGFGNFLIVMLGCITLQRKLSIMAGMVQLISDELSEWQGKSDQEIGELAVKKIRS